MQQTDVTQPTWRKYLPLILIGGGVIMLLISMSGVALAWNNTVRNGLIDRETTLNAQYQANQAELDAFVKKVNEEFQIAGAKTAALDKVLSDAVRGRYDNSLRPATPGSGTQGGGLISALQEAYPNVDVNVYDKIINEISAGRENFKQVQQKLLDQLRGYESYRSKGIFHHMIVDSVGYPRLEARIGTTSYKGKAALNQMHLIVTSGQTNQDFTSGTEGPIQFTPTTVK